MAADATTHPAGRWALVTGATRGIGLAAARALAADGWRMALVARGAKGLLDAVESLGPGAEARTFTADLANLASVDRMAAETMAIFGGPPDAVVMNAGRFSLAPAHQTSLDEFRATLDANLVGTFALARALLPALRARGSGHLVTIGSIADRAVFPGNAAYAASKHAVRALHEVLREELRGSGVRVSLVSPGPTDTPLWDPLDPDNRPGFTPRAQMLRPEAVAEAIRWVLAQPPAVNVDELRLSHA